MQWGRLLSKGQLTPNDSQWVRDFVDGWRGLHAERAQSALTVTLKLVLQWSDQCHLVILMVLSTVSL